MKLQLAALALDQETYKYRQFTIHLHDDLIKLIGLSSTAATLRNRIARALRDRFDHNLSFYKVFENLDSTAEHATRPHIHGAIAVERHKRPRTKAGTLSKSRQN